MQSTGGKILSTTEKWTSIFLNEGTEVLRSYYEFIMVYVVNLSHTSISRYPNIAPPITMNALFIFLKINTLIILKQAISIVLQSVKVSFPISTQTAIITATAAMFMASKNAVKILDFRIFGTNGFKMETKMKEGRKIQIVAAIAPQKPPSCQPIKVAVDKTGPGVNWPTATASINSCRVSKPVLTNSASKNANNTYPLP